MKTGKALLLLVVGLLLPAGTGCRSTAAPPSALSGSSPAVQEAPADNSSVQEAIDVELAFPGYARKAVTFSYDDGCIQDRRLTALFREYGLKATFNLYSACFGESTRIHHGGFELDYSKIAEDEVAALYEGFEVASHTRHHYDLRSLDDATVLEEIASDRQALAALTGYAIDGMAYPGGVYNSHVRDLAEQSGVLYARTINETKSTALPEDFYQWHPTAHDSDPALPGIVDRFLTSSGKELRLLYIWGHSFELDKEGGARWNNLQNLCESLAGRSDVWYADNRSICRYVHALRQYEREGINRSDMTLYGFAGENPVSAAPGQSFGA